LGKIIDDDEDAGTTRSPSGRRANSLLRLHRCTA